jgi:hypothetical protein
MGNLYYNATRFFSQLANACFWPVVISLSALLVVSVIDCGRLVYQVWFRRRRPRTDLAGLARALAGGRSTLERVRAVGEIPLSPVLARFWKLLRDRLAEVECEDNLDLWLEETLQREEIAVSNQLDRSRALIRIGPMLVWPARSFPSDLLYSRFSAVTWAEW